MRLLIWDAIAPIMTSLQCSHCIPWYPITVCHIEYRHRSAVLYFAMLITTNLCTSLIENYTKLSKFTYLFQNTPRAWFVFQMIIKLNETRVFNTYIRDAGDLRRHRAHYDVIVMLKPVPFTSCSDYSVLIHVVLLWRSHDCVCKTSTIQAPIWYI